VLAFAAGLLLPRAPAAQPVRGRVLEGMSLRERGSLREIVIRFSVPIRVLRHSPSERGEVLEISVEPLQVGSADLLAFQRSESLAPPRDSDLPLREVRYRGDQPGRPVLELRFARAVRFQVRSGDDFRSVVIALRRDDVAGYAVQLGSPPAPGAPPLPDLPALRGRRVYVATVEEGGRSWQRLRLGFFRELSEAEAAAAQLDAAFPGAFVVEVTRREIQLSEQSALAPGAGPAPAAAPDQVNELMDEAQRAMTGGEHAKAILIYTKVLSMPESPQSPQAQELLGLARERSGQLAHAKAEYEEYLRRYPEGEAAPRVRQRLAALITAREPAREPREPEAERPEPESLTRFESFGSAFASYRRESLVMQQDSQDDQDVLADSSLFTDLFFDSRLSGERYTARTQLSGGYYYDFLGSDASGIHLSSAFVEGNATSLGLSASLGRRSLSTGGVLGRYDGGRVVKRIGTRWEAALVSGFPVDSPTEYQVDTDRYFAGASLERERLFDVLDAEIFAIHQMVGDTIDRSAVGAELRYVQGSRSLFAYLDYDVYFTSLNIAQLSGNLQVTEHGFLHLLADYRNAPILTTSNALQGQLVSSLDDLAGLLSSSELQGLAEDRTARSLYLNLGGSYNLRENLQLAADANASHLSGTDESGGVPAFTGTGFEYSYTTQLIANGLLRRGDVSILGLRYLDGSAYDAPGLTLSSRQPLSENLRIEPRVLTEYRFRKSGVSDELLLRPGLAFEYRRWKIDLDLEGGTEWLRRTTDDDELGWYALVGLRMDY
jgi:hypothetical protein